MEGGFSRDINDYLSPHDYFCSGSFGKADQPYVTAPVLAVGVATKVEVKNANSFINGVCSFDAAETENAFIGQTNAIVVSSFCGPHGIIWGIDVAVAPKERNPFLKKTTNQGNKEIDIYSARPLLDASKKLFGTVDEKRFPLRPGTHLPSALKTHYADGPQTLFTALAIGIPEDPAKDARLFMEDVGTLSAPDAKLKSDVLGHLCDSVVKVADQQRVMLKHIYAEIETREIKKGETGCALASIPYFLLAKKAAPGWRKSALFGMGLKEWERKTDGNYLHQQ